MVLNAFDKIIEIASSLSRVESKLYPSEVCTIQYSTCTVYTMIMVSLLSCLHRVSICVFIYLLF